MLLTSIAITVGVVALGIEAANCVAYGWFAISSNGQQAIANQLRNGSLSPFDFEIISTPGGFISIVPLSLFSDYYYNPDNRPPRRVLRFTKLHREIQARFQQLQSI